MTLRERALKAKEAYHQAMRERDAEMAREQEQILLGALNMRLGADPHEVSFRYASPRSLYAEVEGYVFRLSHPHARLEVYDYADNEEEGFWKEIATLSQLADVEAGYPDEYHRLPPFERNA